MPLLPLEQLTSVLAVAKPGVHFADAIMPLISKSDLNTKQADGSATAGFVLVPPQYIILYRQVQRTLVEGPRPQREV